MNIAASLSAEATCIQDYQLEEINSLCQGDTAAKILRVNSL